MGAIVKCVEITEPYYFLNDTFPPKLNVLQCKSVRYAGDKSVDSHGLRLVQNVLNIRLCGIYSRHRVHTFRQNTSVHTENSHSSYMQAHIHEYVPHQPSQSDRTFCEVLALSVRHNSLDTHISTSNCPEPPHILSKQFIHRTPSRPHQSVSKKNTNGYLLTRLQKPTHPA